MTRLTMIQSLRKGETLDCIKGDAEIVAKLNALSEFSKWEIVKNKVIRII